MKDISILKDNNVDLDKSLELFGDMKSYEETLIDFLNSISEKLNELLKSKESSDMNSYAVYAHSIKSDARYLGFTSLVDIAYENEMAGKDNDFSFVFSNYDKLEKETKKYIEIAKQYLNSSSDDSKKEKILIVDDSMLIRNLIGKAISNEFAILNAEDGNKAVEIIKKNPNIYGIMLDLFMPNFNGFDVLNYLKENNYKIPVAVITGDDTKETIDKAFRYNIVDVLNKPFNEENIKKILESFKNYN